MELKPISEVYANKTGYEGVGRHWDLWWGQASANKHQMDTLEYILESAWERRQQEFGKYGRGESGEEESNSGSDR